MHLRLSAIIALGLAAFLPAPILADKTVRRDGVVVLYEGIDDTHAIAIARTVQAARSAAARLGFDMPPTINVNVSTRLAGGTGLFNDGDRSIFLTVRSEKDLRKPAESGVFVIYGLGHEVGHLAMYRVVRDHRWMTTAAAEGWAHYLGSRLVDSVNEAEGKDLWPDPYDYREDGMKRLKHQREDARSSPTVRGAGLWADYAELVGDKGVIATFAAWDKAKIDLADPAKALAAGVPADDAAGKWWATAAPLFVAKSVPVPLTSRTAKREDFTGKPRELARDDGTSAGKRSIAGAGHAVAFDAPAENWYLAAVRVFGSRYGGVEDPEDKFTLFVLD